MTISVESTSLTKEIKSLAIASAVTNTRLMELASSQQSLTESVAKLVDAGHQSAVRHANFEQRFINMMEGMESIRNDIASCNKDIKINSQNISSVRSEALANKLNIVANWKMVAGAVSISIASVGATIAVIKIITTGS